MKKGSQSSKKNRTQKKQSSRKKLAPAKSADRSPQKKPVKQAAVRSASKKAVEKKTTGDRSIGRYIAKAGQFLRESKNEMKKVKWPTRKELFAATAVVIVLTLFVSFYLGLVDFGLIKIIKSVIG